MALVDLTTAKRRFRLEARNGKDEPELRRLLNLLARGKYGMLIVREYEGDKSAGTTEAIEFYVGEPPNGLVAQMIRIERELQLQRQR